MKINRMVRESPIPQGVDEKIPYRLTVTPWGSSPTNVSVVVFDITDTEDEADWTDVTATVLPTNEPSILGDVITISKLQALTDGHIYRMEITFTTDLIEDAEAYCLFIGGE